MEHVSNLTKYFLSLNFYMSFIISKCFDIIVNLI